jgi:hypothetical protein
VEESSIVVEKPCFGGTDRLAWSYPTVSAEMVSEPAFLDAGNRKMKKQKPPGSMVMGWRRPEATEDGALPDDDGLVEKKALRSSATGPPAPDSRPAMMRPDSGRKVKTRGRLDRTVLAMLGKGLENCFDEVRKQEVPERFKLLLQQF